MAEHRLCMQKNEGLISGRNVQELMGMRCWRYHKLNWRAFPTLEPSRGTTTACMLAEKSRASLAEISGGHQVQESCSRSWSDESMVWLKTMRGEAQKEDKWWCYPWECQIIMICFDWHAQISKKDLLENGRVECWGHLFSTMVGEHSLQAWKWQTGVDPGMIASIGLDHMWSQKCSPWSWDPASPHGQSPWGMGRKKGEGRKGQIVWLSRFFPPLVLQPVSISTCIDFGKTLSFGILFMYYCNVPKCYNEGENPTIQPSDFSFTTNRQQNWKRNGHKNVEGK